MIELRPPRTIALTALTDLVATARERGMWAKGKGYERIALGLLRIASDLDGARTCLVRDGDSYLEAAWAFVDAGRRMVADYEIRIARMDRARAARA